MEGRAQQKHQQEGSRKGPSIINVLAQTFPDVLFLLLLLPLLLLLEAYIEMTKSLPNTSFTMFTTVLHLGTVR